jgi:hypothetical protein
MEKGRVKVIYKNGVSKRGADPSFSSPSLLQLSFFLKGECVARGGWIV